MVHQNTSPSISVPCSNAASSGVSTLALCVIIISFSLIFCIRYLMFVLARSLSFPFFSVFFHLVANFSVAVLIFIVTIARFHKGSVIVQHEVRPSTIDSSSIDELKKSTLTAHDLVEIFSTVQIDGDDEVLARV